MSEEMKAKAQEWAKTIAMCIPCEVQRLYGRIKNKDWAWDDVPACKYRKANPLAHRVGVVLICGVGLLSGNPILMIAAGAIIAVKARVTFKEWKNGNLGE